jgi:ribosome-binding factor A
MQTKRQLQVAEVVKRNFSEVLLVDGYFIYGEALVTVANVVMSSDLGIAKIYLSIYNTDNKQRVLDLIYENMPKLKGELYLRIRKQLRKMPYLQFFIDDTLDEMYRVDALFKKIKGEEE